MSPCASRTEGSLAEASSVRGNCYPSLHVRGPGDDGITGDRLAEDMSQDSGPIGLPELRTNTNLLQRAQGLDPAAWTRLVTLYAPLVYHWCRLRGLQPADAENTGQDVFLSVFRSLGSFVIRPEDGTFRAWLKETVLNRIRDHMRKRARQPTATSGGDLLVTIPAQLEQDGSDPQEANQDTVRLYQKAVSLIRSEYSERDWQIFLRVVVDGAEPSDVATELRVSLNVIYLVKSRIIGRLKIEFEGLL